MLQKEDLVKARIRLTPFTHKTPLLQSETLNKITGAKLWFKCENFQKTGSFKARGATNALLKLSSDVKAVATHSSGNHGQALAWAAKQQGKTAYIVMPENAPEVKVNAVKHYGGEVIFCTPTLEARESTLAEVQQKTGATFIHPYDFWDIIEGQSTAAQEVYSKLQPDILCPPVGGGGLLAGSALATRYFSSSTKVIACEPKGADDAYRSFTSGSRITSHTTNTMADGLLTTLGEKNFEVIKQNVNEIITCSEESIVQAMRMLWERMKLVVEPSGAVPLATILEHKSEFKDKEVVIIISGGNVDLARLPF